MSDDLKIQINSDPDLKDLTIDSKDKLHEVLYYLRLKETNTDESLIVKFKTDPYWHSIYVPTKEYANRINREKLFKIKGEDSRDYAASFTNFNTSTHKRQHAYQSARAMIEDYNMKKTTRGLYIYSKQFQIGKTYLANAITNDFADRHIPGIFVFAPSLVSQSREFKNLESIMGELKTAEVLVIDDLGSEYRSEWFRLEVLMPVLQSRLTGKKLTIITSNYDLDELRKLYLQNSNQMDVDRLMTRIIELCKPVELDDYYGNGKK